MTPQYHQRSFDLLALTPGVAPDAVTALDNLERQHGIDIPASAREWFSQTDAITLLERHSSPDPVIPIAEWPVERNDTHGGGPHNLLANGLLPYRYENQAVCVWAIQLDGSDDPPVLVDVDSQFKNWRVACKTFSTHIYCWLWDYAIAMGRDLLVMANIEPASRATLEALAASFDQQPQTNSWPGDVQHHFFRDDATILIWASEDQADWFLSADTEESLQRLLRDCWEIQMFVDDAYSNSDAGEAILKRLRC